MTPDPAALRDALAELELPLDVQADGALALLALRPGAALPASLPRDVLLHQARAAGFTHVALLLPDE